MFSNIKKANAEKIFCITLKGELYQWVKDKVGWSSEAQREDTPTPKGHTDGEQRTPPHCDCSSGGCTSCPALGAWWLWWFGAGL